jgi:hypothetical protein
MCPHICSFITTLICGFLLVMGVREEENNNNDIIGQQRSVGVGL